MKAALLLALSIFSVQAQARSHELARHTVDRADGSTISYWLEQGQNRSSEVVLVMQGTGCEAVSEKPNLHHAANILSPNARTLLIDKVGVGLEGDATTIDGCPKAYWDHYTLSLRVEDCLRVIADLRRQPWWNRRIVIFGGSEGGAVAALLAPLVPEAKAVVVLSSGTGVAIGDLIRAAIPPEMAAEAPSVYAAAHKRPTGDERWAGLSYRWWDDAVDLVPARSLAQTPAPVLLIHGARDRSSPVETARAGHTMLRTAGKANAEYWEFADLDHSMQEAGGTSHMDDVLIQAAKWIRTSRSMTLPRKQK
ncbi:alpha/beta hydrolase family protein [Sphingomonas faeni]|uniref:alpha/beta hydrolase family protein n=1 Tax=Sphingomonas faeni TaxID=185950 RepID=UPI0027813141|nr:prolyl oligopeptidase family serine peptidase [Sphingomonas faeni]MDQ0839245.1 pimeloyl-ACP methyl ester carboxylesterase [Sphingomonas faeni]